MAAYEYTALNATGKKKSGVLEADNERHLRQKLREQGLAPLQIKEAKESGLRDLFSPSVSIKERALFTRQLATLIDAGLPIEEALSGVANQTSKQKIRSMLLAVRSKVLEGHSLATALAPYPKAFPILFRSSVKAGEESGRLSLVLLELADFSERMHTNAQKIQMAMLYPGILTIVAIAIVSFLLGSVMPDIVSVFDKQGAELPTITNVMLALSHWVVEYGAASFFAFVGILFLYALAMRKPAIKAKKDALLLRIPGISKLVKTRQITHFISTLAMLSRSGVALVDAMMIAGQVVDNDRISQLLLAARTRVKEGQSLERALSDSKLLPPMMLQLIISGERSGELDIMLDKAARQQEQESNAKLTAAVGLFEPLLLLVMGGVVMMIVMAILLPIMNMNQLLH